MKKNISSVLQYIFFLGLGFGLIWYSSKDLTDSQVDELLHSFSQTRYLYILPVIISLMVSHFHRSLRWRLLMAPMGYTPGRANTYLVVLIGYFFNLLVPRLGEVMKCTMLAKYEKVPADKLVGTIVAERAIDLICLVLVAIFMVITQFDLLGETAISGLKKTWQQADILSITLWLAAIAAGLLLLRYIIHRFAHIHVFATIRKIGSGIWHGLTSIGQLREKWWFIFHTIMIWLLYLVSIYLGFKAFPAVENLSFNASVAILVFGSLGMIATQGGIGAYQLAVEKTLLLYGIKAVTGLAFGWVLWGAQTAIVLIAGIASLLIMPFINRKNSTDA